MLCCWRKNARILHLRADTAEISDHAGERRPSLPQRVLTRLKARQELRISSLLSLGVGILPPLFLLWRMVSLTGDETARCDYEQMVCWTVIAQGIGLLAAAFFSRRIFKRVGRSFQKLADVIDSLAEGHIEQRMDAGHRRDEIDELAESLDRLLVASRTDRESLMENNVALVLANEKLAEANAELETANRRVREFAEQAGTANAAKRTFLAVMSHEIRTPVNGIIGMTELAMKTNLDSGQRDYVETINNTAQGLLELLTGVLDFSKIEAGKLELEVSDFSLRREIGDATGSFAARHHSKGLDLVLDIAPDVPDALIGDPLRLRQILLNLLSNANRFTERGEVAVTVQVEEHGEVETRLRVSVTDTGCGIAREQQASIFEHFTQGDSSTTRHYGGSGLGLTICRQLVHLMDGDIRVVSEAGAGSRFDFTAVFGVGTSSEKVDTTALTNARVLLLESHARSAEITERIMEDWSLHVQTVRSVNSGRGMLASDASLPDLVIIDTLRPASGGIELAQHAVDCGIDPSHIILLTSASGTDDSGLHMPDGVQRLTKPVREVKLRDALLRAANAGGVTPAATNRENASNPPHGRKLKILVAEDNATNRRIIRTYLEAWGHTVTAAKDGSDAVLAFADGGFDLVLMDLQMPRMDGIAATASIRQMEGHAVRVPIIALTANVLKGIREECFAAGMCGYLPKPVREHELLAAIEAVVPGLCVASAVAALPALPPVSLVAERTEPFEIAALVGSVNGSHCTLAGLLEDCRDGDFPELFAQLSSALDANELPKVQRSAHAMKGVIGVFHAPAAYAAAKRIEENARLGNVENLRQQADELRRAVSELLTSLERFVSASPLLSRAA